MHARVAAPPARPLLVFDGDCGFCKFWIHRWQRSTGDRVDYVALQTSELRTRFPEIAREQFIKSVHLIEPSGLVYRGAEAVFRLLADNPRRGKWLWIYQKIPGFAPVAEWSYRFVANHRRAIAALTKMFFGKK